MSAKDDAALPPIGYQAVEQGAVGRAVVVFSQMGQHELLRFSCLHLR